MRPQRAGPGGGALKAPEYLGWLDEHPERDATLLMGATTYRVMSSFAAEAAALESDDTTTDEASSLDELTRTPKVVFSSTLQTPLSWANTELVSGEAIEAVRTMKRDADRPMRTIGSVSLCRSLVQAGIVDRLRVVVFPVITGNTGRERIYDNYPDIALDMIASRTFDDRIQLLEYVPRVLDNPPQPLDV